MVVAGRLESRGYVVCLFGVLSYMGKFSDINCLIQECKTLLEGSACLLYCHHGYCPVCGPDIRQRRSFVLVLLRGLKIMPVCCQRFPVSVENGP